MERQIALDLRRYSTPDKMSSLPTDTASLSIEASENPETPRVNPHFYIKRSDDYVIAPGMDKRDVLEMFVEDVGNTSTDAGKKIREGLLKDKLSSAYVWISAPSGSYEPETRIEVGVKKITKSGKFEYQKFYGISTTLNQNQCLSLGQLLVSITSETTEFPQTAEELRKIVIKLNVPNDQDPFEYLSQLIKLPESNIWESILNGQADKNKAKALKAAMVATEPVRSNPQIIYSNPFVYGAYIENRMKSEGYGMNLTKSGCGGSNSEMSNSNTTKAPEYNSNITATIESSFPCPRCHGAIPSGRGITTCPHCGLTKEQAGSTCG